MTKPKKPTDAQIRKRLSGCIGGKAPDDWGWAIGRLRKGKVCVVVDRGRELHCVFIGIVDGQTISEFVKEQP